MHEKRLGTIGWGLFFLWLGIVLYLNLGVNNALIGAGIIMLVIQCLRKYFGMKVEIFWVSAGGLLIIVNLLNQYINFVIPIILIVFGAIFIISAVRKR